jgi:four helix bundle protein
MGFAFEELQVYQKALDFAAKVVSASEDAGATRKHYRIIEQLEGACTSVALNIAEGKGRFSKKEFKHHLYIARGALYETLALLQLFRKLDWLPEHICKGLYADAEEISRMISGLVNSLTE